MHNLNRIAGVLKTVDARLRRKDFLGAYRNLHSCSVRMAEQFQLEDLTIQPLKGGAGDVLNYFRKHNYVEAYSVLKYLKQQLKTQGYKYQS